MKGPLSGGTTQGTWWSSLPGCQMSRKGMTYLTASYWETLPVTWYIFWNFCQSLFSITSTIFLTRSWASLSCGCSSLARTPSLRTTVTGRSTCTHCASTHRDSIECKNKEIYVHRYTCAWDSLCTAGKIFLFLRLFWPDSFRIIWCQFSFKFAVLEIVGKQNGWRTNPEVAEAHSLP